MRHRGITLARFDGTGPLNDVVQIACELAIELRRRTCAIRCQRGAPYGVGSCRCPKRLQQTGRVCFRCGAELFERLHRARSAAGTAGEQQPQQQPERVAVARCRDLVSLELFGRCELRCERGADLTGQSCLLDLGLSVQQLCDAKVQQLHSPGGGDEHIRRLQITVDDQVRVRMCDSVQYMQEQANPLFDRQSMLIAVSVNRHPCAVFEHQERLILVAHAGIEQPSNVRMCELREVSRFEAEAPECRLLMCSRQQFYSYAAFVLTIAALGSPDAPHAAAADELHERVRTEALARECRRNPSASVHIFEQAGDAESRGKPFKIHRGSLGGLKERFDLCAQARVAGALVIQVLLAQNRIEIQCLDEDAVGLLREAVVHVSIALAVKLVWTRGTVALYSLDSGARIAGPQGRDCPMRVFGLLRFSVTRASWARSLWIYRKDEQSGSQ